MYFVKEYLQPIQSEMAQRTITIVAAHGNLLTSFDYIIGSYANRMSQWTQLKAATLPHSTGLLHAEMLQYHSIGAKPLRLERITKMAELPITVNHAMLSRDLYYRWAAEHQCKVSSDSTVVVSLRLHSQVSHLRENRDLYIFASVIDRVFGIGPFANQMLYHAEILQKEMSDEFESHLVPMMVRTCRDHLTRLPLIQANTNFFEWSRAAPPIPVPETEEEQKSAFPARVPPFSAYGLPFPVLSGIEAYRTNFALTPGRILTSRVHAESRTLLFLVRHDK